MVAGEETASAPKPTRLAPSPPLLIHSPSQDASSYLHNRLQLSERIYSGAQPEVDAAFAEIAELGVRTIVSVDGARPDVEAAKRAGLRYVHIPIGYDGLDRKAKESIVNLVKTADGPFYIHCHHGKHRGPAAAAIACIAEGSADNDSALQILAKAGTSKNYAGLYRDVSEFQMPPADAPLPKLVPIAEVNSMASLMVVIDQAHEHLKMLKKNDWAPLNRHPDLRSHTEANLLREGLREAMRLKSTQPPSETSKHDEAYWMQMADAERLAEQLADALQQKDYALATKRLHATGVSCTKCHDEYRN